MSVDMGGSPTIQAGTVIENQNEHHIVVENDSGALELRPAPYTPE